MARIRHSKSNTHRATFWRKSDESEKDRGKGSAASKALRSRIKAENDAIQRKLAEGRERARQRKAPKPADGTKKHQDKEQP